MTAHARATAETLLSSAALNDYRRATATLRDAIEARLAAALPPGTKQFALCGIDPVTPIVIDAARRLQFEVVAIYMRDNSMWGDSFAGVPILNVAVLPTLPMATMVLTGGEGADLRTIRANARPAERIVELCDDCAALAAESADVLRTTAALAADAGRLPEALRLYRRLLRRWPADATVIHYCIATLYQQIGNPQRARWWFGRVLAAPDADAALKSKCHFHLGGLCLNAGEPQAAADHFMKAKQSMLELVAAGE